MTKKKKIYIFFLFQLCFAIDLKRSFKYIAIHLDIETSPKAIKEGDVRSKSYGNRLFKCPLLTSPSAMYSNRLPIHLDIDTSPKAIREGD